MKQQIKDEFKIDNLITVEELSPEVTICVKNKLNKTVHVFEIELNRNKKKLGVIEPNSAQNNTQTLKNLEVMNILQNGITFLIFSAVFFPKFTHTIFPNFLLIVLYYIFWLQYFV